LGALDIGGLTGLVSAAGQDDNGFPVLAVGYAIASVDLPRPNSAAKTTTPAPISTALA